MSLLFPAYQTISDTHNTHYTIAKVAPSAPILQPSHPWEGLRNHLYGSVIKTGDLYRMYYQTDAMTICYATSTDGLTWEKPLINVADFSKPGHGVIQANNASPLMVPPQLNEGQTLTNIVSNLHMPSIIYEPKSDRPYKLFAFGEAGYHAQYALDGERFKPFERDNIIELLKFENKNTKKTWVSDVSPCFLDRTGYTAMVKTYETDAKGRTRRCVGRSTSQDFQHWSEVETVWVPGDYEDVIAKARGFNWADFYGLCPFPYGEGYLGFLWLFEIEHELPNGTHLGKMEVFLASSPDGKHWQRLSEHPFIPWDLNFGELGGMVTTPSAPLFDENDIKLYYSDSNFEHGHGEKDFKKVLDAPTWVIRCATLPKERLVGISAQSGHFTINTPPNSLKRLRLNAECKQGNISIDYIFQNHCIHTENVTGIDSTDLWLTPNITEIDKIKINLNHATVYAVGYET